MTEDTTKAVAAALIALALPTAIGLAAGWPTWVVVLIAVAAPAAAVLAVRRRAHLRGQRALRAESERPAHREAERPAAREHPVSSITLPTALADYRVAFSCTVHWRPTGHADGHADPAAAAVDAVVRRARLITAAHDPEDTAVEPALAAALGQPEEDPAERVVAWATGVRVELDPEDLDRLRRAAGVRKQRHLWEQEVAAERAVRAYLGDEVLTSTGSALVWWLARDTGRVREAADLIGTFARLSAAAHDREVDGVFRPLVAAHPGPTTRPDGSAVNGSGSYGSGAGGAVPDGFAPNGSGEHAGDVDPRADLLPEPEGNALFGHRLAELLDQHEAPDRARRARDLYGASDWRVEPPEDD